MAVTPDYPLLALIAAGTATAIAIAVLRLASGHEGSFFSSAVLESATVGLDEE